MNALVACIDACFDCAQTCTSCADACLGESSVAELVRCIRLNLDCADICETTGRLLTRQTGANEGVVRSQLEACPRSLPRLRRGSEKHAAHMNMEHCRVCAEACRACEQACEQVLNA